MNKQDIDNLRNFFTLCLRDGIQSFEVDGKEYMLESERCIDGIIEVILSAPTEEQQEKLRQAEQYSAVAA